ncbi:sperm-associated antigen 16 protein isoform X2 [Stegostoma tigrinum]|uniref:sperm-associated antigen 16 protein isoform X2 n=1 Tax=Stegostoma tigrinum TaxID=3053191 RepID=UPI00286FB1CC|nr:sperm-associated antigen 16 protein isoform X2 [Stegostoma tigrinum]
MSEEQEDGTFYLQQVTITEESEGDYQYEEIPVDDDISIPEGEESLENIVKTIEQRNEDLKATFTSERVIAASLLAEENDLVPVQPVCQGGEVVDDFLRNFLIKMGMMKTLECFQIEWYEMLQKGLLKLQDVGFVPDVYAQNQLLENEVKNLKKDLENCKIATKTAGETLVKLRKERDFHRMHHKRVAQEKNRLINDIKRLKKHYESFEPTLSRIKEKYNTAIKQKMLTSLEKDRALVQVSGLQATLRAMECGWDLPVAVTSGNKGHSECKKDGPSQRALAEARALAETKEDKHHCDPPDDSTKQLDSEFPVDTRVNPYLAQMKGSPSNLLRSGGCKLTKTLKVHELAVSCLALHPRKQILVTGSDERLWKMWSIPNGDIIMTGEGHGDWLSGCCFHPSGNMLATTSGDKTVKIWDFTKVECASTFTGHLHAVWGCSWHSCGDFVASCSMDNTIKIWDINSKRCRQTLRGHVDSVNSVEFLPFSNTLLSSATDKTISLWDSRTGLCAQTFFGHLHSCNDATFNLKGDTVVSCDSYGILKLWDVRKVAIMLSVDAGPHPGNQVIFHPSGQLVVMASNDGTVKILDLPSGQLYSLSGHEDAVQCVLFDHKGEYVVSGGSDGTIRLWT